MANHADSIGTHVSVGKSAVWAPGGELLAEANGTETTLVIATRTKETWKGEAVPMQYAVAAIRYRIRLLVS